LRFLPGVRNGFFLAGVVNVGPSNIYRGGVIAVIAERGREPSTIWRIVL
jgi:hypothetical protein